MQLRPALSLVLVAALCSFLGALGCGGEDTVGASDEGEAEATATETEAEAVPEAPPPPDAAAVADEYLRAGAAENAERVLELLDPDCHTNEAMTRVDAARVMGAPMTIEELSVAAQEAGDTASVAYEVSGSAHGEGGTTEIMGMQVQTGEVNVEDANQSGTLNMRRIDGQWRVTCSAAVPSAPRG